MRSFFLFVMYLIISIKKKTNGNNLTLFSNIRHISNFFVFNTFNNQFDAHEDLNKNLMVNNMFYYFFTKVLLSSNDLISLIWSEKFHKESYPVKAIFNNVLQ